MPKERTIVVIALEEDQVERFIAKMPKEATWAKDTIEPNMMNNTAEWQAVASSLAQDCCQRIAQTTGQDLS